MVYSSFCFQATDLEAIGFQRFHWYNQHLHNLALIGLEIEDGHCIRFLPL